MTQLPDKKMTNRAMFFLIAFLVAGFGILTARLFKIQILDHDWYTSQASEQQTRDTTVAAKRGAIYSANGETLAQSASTNTVQLSPASITDGQEEMIARFLSETLGVNYDTVYAKTKKDNYYEIVKRKVEPELADKIRAFIDENDVTGIALVEDSKRYYPLGSLASHVIGFTGTEGQGLWGLEAYYDKYLKGTAGRIVTERTASGTEMPFEHEQYIDAQDGSNLTLTLDTVVQGYLEKHMETLYAETNPSYAAAIVMDVNTGGIIGMAQYPEYDLNDPFTLTDEKTLSEIDALPEADQDKAYSTALEAMWRNVLVSDGYEPGSVFKTVTSAIALEEDVIDPKTFTFTCTGSLNVEGTRISCWRTWGHGTENFAQGLQNSCNPFFMTVGLKIGGATMDRYFDAFGLKEPTGIDLYGESSGIPHTAEDLEGPVELATTAFGQTFKVTSLQMITASAAAVNGGYLVTPHLVDKITDTSGQVIFDYDETPRRQVVSRETSAELAEMLESVVAVGTGKNAYISGYRIGGKTGTSEKTDIRDENGQTYLKTLSFMAFTPADDPQYMMLVIIDEPADGERTGGSTVAPASKKIMQDIWPYLGITPQYTAEELAELEVTIPYVVGSEITAARDALSDAGFSVRIVGDGDTVLSQIPRAGNTMPSGERVILYTEEGVEAETGTVPDVIGCGAAEANQRLVNAGFNIRVSGQSEDSGAVVKSQSIEAGAEAPLGSIVTVDFVLQTGD